ncbi:MAG: hypothetical protein BGO33_07960 [Bacteroidia bacterium 43-41]|nr:MAG: hypothetical protein BGO33_07960 [Bacteroidia bacterium 43-41]
MDLYIVGAGNVGAFVAYHAKDMGSYNLKGFLDIIKQHQVLYDLPVLGDEDLLLEISKPVAVAIAIANPTIKRKVIDKLKTNSNIEFPNFIHPTVWIGNKVRIGKGCIIYPGVTINYETDIKDFVTVNMNATIGHNCKLDDFSTVSPGVNLGGGTLISKGGFVGIGASTIQGVIIGEDAIVGGMTMVIANVPDKATTVGNPNKIIKTNK